MNDRYATQGKLKYNLPLCGVGENNLLPFQTIPSDNNEESLVGTTAATRLLSSPTNSSASTNHSHNSAR